MSYDSDVVSATSGRGEPDWDKIIKLCNRIRDSIGTLSMAQAMGSVMRRVKHTDSSIQLHALTLLESCVSNCGQDFQLELNKSTFHTDVKTILTGPYTDPRVKSRLKDLLGSWVTEFKNNSKMTSLVKFVDQLRREGVASQPSPSVPRQQQPAPTARSGDGEDADLKKAIELSLLDSKTTPATSSVSLYPAFSSTPAPILKKKVKALKKVRAIYDFVAAEDNELSFRAGEVITVLDDSDENWWRGETQLGKGLFPASFVSANLSVEPQPAHVEKESQSSGQKKKNKKAETKVVVINEEKIELLLDMIKKADVTSEENKAENDTLLELEGECKKMKPLVDEQIVALQRQEDEMLEVNKKFEDALALYRKLLAEGPKLSSTLPQKQPMPQSQPSLAEPAHSTLPPQAQAHNTILPQAHLHSTLPQPQSTLPPPAQLHTTLPQGYTTLLHTLPQAQPHSTQSVTAQLPPPPYTPSSVGLSGGLYTQQGGMTPEPARLEQPAGVGQYRGLGMVGQAQPTVNSQQNSYYTQQLDSIPSQMRSGLATSSVPPLVNPQSATYQQNFYPQQQQQPQPLL